MEKERNYKYSLFDCLKQPQTYQYSEYGGMEFIKAYSNIRLTTAHTLKSKYLQSIASSKEQDINILAECCYFQSFFVEYLDENLKTKLVDLLNTLINSEKSLENEHLLNIAHENLQKINLINKKGLPKIEKKGGFLQELWGNRRTGYKLSFITKEWVNLLKKSEKFNLNKILKEIFLILELLEEEETNREIYRLLSIFLKKFEVKKKLYEEYSSDFKNIDQNYELLNNYILLSVILADYYQKYPNLKFINAVLKLNDLICSIQSKLESPLDIILSYIALTIEKKEIKKLFDKNGIENEIR